MFKQEELLKNITDSLAVLEISIRNRGILNLRDQNIIAESFFAKLLNIIYGYNLINLNSIEKNCPAVDLGDINKRIFFQVTSTTNRKK
jgi:hypothetical protein